MAYVCILAMTVCAVVFAKKNGFAVEKKTVALAVIIELLGAGLGVYDNWKANEGFLGVLERENAKGFEKKEELMLKTDDKEEEWIVSVSPVALSEDEKKECIARAVKEIDDTVLGDNQSADRITVKLNPKTSYSDGFVKASWSFSDPMLVSAEGELLYERLEEKAPCSVYASAQLSCGDMEEEYSFPLYISMPKPESEAGFKYYLDKALKQADEKNPVSKEVLLPTNLGGVKLTWKKNADKRGLIISVLGLAAGIGIVLGRLEEEKSKKQKLMRELSSDYPDIVSALSLYVSAGITVRASLGRLFAGYSERKREGKIRDRPGYEAIGKIIRQMEDGVGEEAAYANLGRMTGHKDYSKLSMMLTKHVKHGSMQLASQLEKEEAQAFEARKLLARTLGEEASTKLLAPMMLLLSVVIAVLVAPAMFSMTGK